MVGLNYPSSKLPPQERLNTGRLIRTYSWHDLYTSLFHVDMYSTLSLPSCTLIAHFQYGFLSSWLGVI